MDEEDEQDLADITSNHAIALPKKKGKKNKSKTTTTTTHKGNVHQEVTTTIGDGFQTIRVREVHVGGNRNHENNNHIPVFNLPMGVPTIIVRPKNLKMRGEKAAPFQMFRRIDDIFDSFFENLLGDIIEEQHKANIEMEKSVQEIEKKMQNRMKKDNDKLNKESNEELDVIDEVNNINKDGHIKLTGVKDITNEKADEKENRESNKVNKEKENSKDMENKTRESNKDKTRESNKDKTRESNKDEDKVNPYNKVKEAKETETSNKIKDRKEESSTKPTGKPTPTSTEEEHGLAISYDPSSNTKESHSSDRVMTPRERRKQIKEEKKKAKFAKICKFVFYAIVLFTIYILIRRLLVLLGIIEDSKVLDAGNSNTETVPLQGVEMKSTEKKE
jgi:hypothetical protein